jgi:type II secretory pathway component PulC
MRSVFLAVFAALVGCAHAAAPAPEEPPAVQTNRVATEAFVTRAELHAILDAGLGRFLQRVDTEPVLSGGQFRGFRLKRLDIGGPNAGLIDLAPGDVVQSLNGRSIDRPEHALEAWESLREADAIVVALLRDGARRELRVPIVD